MPNIKNNYKVSDQEIISAIASSFSIRQTLQKLGLCDTGTAYRNIKRRIKSLNLDTSHFLGKGYLKGGTHNWAPKVLLSTILIKESTYENIASLKTRLIKEQVLLPVCVECGLTNHWNGKPLNLQLDHINGIYNDHRIENLRFLCPNCHSQTETFAGRNIGAEGGSRTLIPEGAGV